MTLFKLFDDYVGNKNDKIHGCVKNDHKFCGLKQYPFIVSQFSCSEV